MRTSVDMRLRVFMTEDDVAIVLSQSQIAGRGPELGPDRVAVFGVLPTAAFARFHQKRHRHHGGNGSCRFSLVAGTEGARCGIHSESGAERARVPERRGSGRRTGLAPTPRVGE